jgi:hypothetical protein
MDEADAINGWCLECAELEEERLNQGEPISTPELDERKNIHDD